MNVNKKCGKQNSENFTQNLIDTTKLHNTYKEYGTNFNLMYKSRTVLREKYLKIIKENKLRRTKKQYTSSLSDVS